jgi:hypothetical protein
MEETAIVVMGLTMGATEIVKQYIPEEKKEKAKVFVPFLILAFGIGFNIGVSALIGDGLVVREAAWEGLKLAAGAAGIYGLGKAALGKS